MLNKAERLTNNSLNSIWANIFHYFINMMIRYALKKNEKEKVVLHTALLLIGWLAGCLFQHCTTLVSLVLQLQYCTARQLNDCASICGSLTGSLRSKALFFLNNNCNQHFHIFVCFSRRPIRLWQFFHYYFLFAAIQSWTWLSYAFLIQHYTANGSLLLLTLYQISIFKNVCLLESQFSV